MESVVTLGGPAMREFLGYILVGFILMGLAVLGSFALAELPAIAHPHPLIAFVGFCVITAVCLGTILWASR